MLCYTLFEFISVFPSILPLAHEPLLTLLVSFLPPSLPDFVGNPEAHRQTLEDHSAPAVLAPL
jgi:hypothetical protein